MDDIVTRLREQHASFRVAVGVNQNIVLHTLYTEAADEIERLRADRDRWRKVAMMVYGNGLGHDGGCPGHPRNRKRQEEGEWPIGYSTDCDCGKSLFDEAVRGER